MQMALLGDEGGKNALRGGTLGLGPQFRNGGSRRLVVFSGLQVPCTLAAGRRRWPGERGGKTG